MFLHADRYGFPGVCKSVAFGRDGPYKPSCIETKHPEAIVIVSDILQCAIESKKSQDASGTNNNAVPVDAPLTLIRLTSLTATSAASPRNGTPDTAPIFLRALNMIRALSSAKSPLLGVDAMPRSDPIDGLEGTGMLTMGWL